MNAIAHEVRLAFTAVQFFTRLPVPGWVGHSADRLGPSARYLPLVGIVVGAIAGLSYLLAAQVLPHPVSAVLAMIAAVLATGGFHEDGLADTCDGLGGGRSREDALRIMKDSRVGSFGVIGLACAFLLRFACLAALPAASLAWVMVGAHGFSRFMAVTVMHTQRYVRDDDGTAKAKPAAARVDLPSVAFAALLAAAPLAFLGWAAVTAAAGALVARILMARWFLRRLGGYTGDCLGALQQVAELAFYLGFLAWMST